MEIHVDMALCQSHGQCVFAAPEVFSFDEEDRLVYVTSADEDLRAAVSQAAGACPVRAIHIDSTSPVGKEPTP
ncbi:ferredoxin [Saccharopolyspora shandongensis]|uniref:ferredoxin n=1 Tax=Saccharopolyspora shandongensis TaxID=418495 RepID=UPI0033F10C55